MKVRIRWDVISLFVVLAGMAASTIIFFMRKGSYRGYQIISERMIEEIGRKVVASVSAQIQSVQLVAELTKSQINSVDAISPDNQLLINYILDSVRLDPLMKQMTIAGVNGNVIQVSDLAFQPNKYFHNQPTVALPPGTQYAVRTIDANPTKPSEEWKYLNTNLTTITQETAPTISSRPQLEEWYARVERWPRLYWETEVDPVGGFQLLSCFVSLQDPTGKMIGVAKLDISLDLLDNLITYQSVGKTGKVMLIDESGRPMTPQVNLIQFSTEQLIALENFDKLLKSGIDSTMVSKNNVEYIVYLIDYPLDPTKIFYVITVVPFNDLFLPVITIENNVALISSAILVLFGIIVFFASKHISRPINSMNEQVQKIKEYDFSDQPEVETTILEMSRLASSIQEMRQSLQQFLHFCSPYIPTQIFKDLVESKKELKIAPERRDITVLFSDLQDFTTYFEQLPIHELMKGLTEYLDTLSKIILEHKGTIDKYIGDSIMAFWNAPHLVPDHDERACIAALTIIKICKQAENKTFPWVTRIGIHSGDAIIGNIGTPDRMNYTALGTSVNTAARLQTLNKEYHTSILITETILDKLGPRFITRPIERVALRGRQIRLTVYELIGCTDIPELEPSPDQIALCRDYATAYGHIHNGHIKEGQELLLEINKKFPGDHPTKVLLEKLKDPTNPPDSAKI